MRIFFEDEFDDFVFMYPVGEYQRVQEFGVILTKLPAILLSLRHSVQDLLLDELELFHALDPIFKVRTHQKPFGDLQTIKLDNLVPVAALGAPLEVRHQPDQHLEILKVHLLDFSVW